MMLTIPAGVYRVRNRITGHVYIGSGVNIYARIKAHIGALERRQHHNRRLQADWVTYGREAFAFSVLEVTPKDQVVRIASENRWMDKYRLPESKLYNARPARLGCPEKRRRPAARQQEGGAS